MLVIVVALQVLLVNLFGGVCGQGREYEKDFEVFQSGGGDRSQSIYTIYDEEDQKRDHHHGIEGPLGPYGAESKITYLPYYLSPDDLVRKYRSATEKYGHNDREGSLRSYDEFFNRNFGQDYNNYNSKAPLRSAVEDEETEHETEAPRAGPKKSKKSSSRRANYRAPPKSEEVEEYEPHDYNYGQSHSYQPSYEYQRIKALSEAQAKEIQQNPSHCKTVQKEEMECHVCHDPKSGAKSESCSYASRPTAKKYAFVKEKKYNSNDDDAESGEEDQEEAPKTRRSESLRSARPQRRPKAENTHAALTATPASRQRAARGKKSRENRPQRDVVGLDPYLYGSADDDDDEDEEEEEKPRKHKKASHAKLKSYEDYFSHVFPEQNGRKSKEELKAVETEYEFLPDYEHKKNVEEVLAEFKTRDWSKCKKSQKGDLTCYECKDPNGVLHEECMFVSESNPRSSRLTYEENKKYAQPDKEEEEQQPIEEEDEDEDYDNAEDASPSEVVTKRSAKLRQRVGKKTDSTLNPADSLDQKLPKKRTI